MKANNLLSLLFTSSTVCIDCYLRPCYWCPASQTFKQASSRQKTFLVATSILWNALHLGIREASTLYDFRHRTILDSTGVLDSTQRFCSYNNTGKSQVSWICYVAVKSTGVLLEKTVFCNRNSMEPIQCPLYSSLPYLNVFTPSVAHVWSQSVFSNGIWLPSNLHETLSIPKRATSCVESFCGYLHSST